MEAGDVAIGLASSGLHSNGYALARRVLLDDAGSIVDQPVRGLERAARRRTAPPDADLRPPGAGGAAPLQRKRMVKAMAHITGSGLPGNVPRILPPNCDAVLRRGSWPVPPIFGLLDHTACRRRRCTACSTWAWAS